MIARTRVTTLLLAGAMTLSLSLVKTGALASVECDSTVGADGCVFHQPAKAT